MSSQLSLEEVLVQVPPRETSGALSANRVDFQKSWALCKLIELHRSGQEYLVVFELHDDVLVLHSAADPPRVDFFQVKTKTTSGEWTAGALIKRKQGKSGPLPSHLGNLIGNLLAFPDHAGNLTLVSNRAFRLKLNGGKRESHPRACLDELDPSELETLLSALKTEHNLTTNPSCAQCTHLASTVFDVGGHHIHALGELTEYMAELYPNQSFDSIAALRALCDEIRRRTHEERVPRTPDELRDQRGFSRKGFSHLLKVFGPRDEWRSKMESEISSLERQHAPYGIIDGLRDALVTYEVDRMDNSKLVFQRARRSASRSVLLLRQQDSIPESLLDFIETILVQCDSHVGSLSPPYSKGYIRLIALEAIIATRGIQEVSAESEDEVE